MLAVDPHERWAAQHLLRQAGYDDQRVGFHLLLDPALAVSATYGVAFQMRIHREISSRPTTFVIDKEGVLRFAQRGTSYADRPTTDELLEILRGL